jgi:hypothetical protein
MNVSRVADYCHRAKPGVGWTTQSRCKEGSSVGRIIVANRRGHQLVEWNPDLETDEAQEGVLEAERILREAREKGCAVSKKVGMQHVLDDGAFDPYAEEYQIIAPIAGG